MSVAALPEAAAPRRCVAIDRGRGAGSKVQETDTLALREAPLAPIWSQEARVSRIGPRALEETPEGCGIL